MSESWGEYIGGLLLLFVAILFSFWGSSGIFKRELHWEDSSEQSTGAKGTVRGGISVVLGVLIIFIGLGLLGGAMYLLSDLEWYPLSWVVFLRILVLVLIIVLAIVLGILIYRGKIVGIQDNTTQKATFRALRDMRKLHKKYKGKVAPLPYDPTWLVELAKEQIPEETDIINSLKLCTTIIGFSTFGDIYFNDPESTDWQTRNSIIIYKKDKWESEIWVTVSDDKRIISIGEEP